MPVAANPGTWTVDDDLLDFPGADFSRIQDAIDAATSGDTIVVYPGTYSENMLVDKSLTIMADGGVEQTVIEGLDTEAHNVHVTADGVTLDGFALEGPATYSHNSAICLAGVTSCVLSNNRLVSSRPPNLRCSTDRPD
jgi:pectin methylesterase-like acyl-CoA thioesterase